MRNLLIFQQHGVDVASLISQVKALTECTKEATDTFQQTQGRNRQKEIQKISWLKPHDPYVKLNCDGAHKFDNGCAGAGCIIGIPRDIG